MTGDEQEKRPPTASPGEVHGDARAPGEPAGTATRLETEADRCIYAGEIDRAKRFYGLAIDASLGAGEYEQALRVAQKLLRVAPDTIRVRLTLTFLLLGAGEIEPARDALEGYVEAVRASGTESFAIPPLILLGQSTDDPGFRERISRIVAEMGASEPELRAFAAASPHPPEESRDDRWKRLLRVAVE